MRTQWSSYATDQLMELRSVSYYAIHAHRNRSSRRSAMRLLYHQILIFRLLSRIHIFLFYSSSGPRSCTGPVRSVSKIHYPAAHVRCTCCFKTLMCLNGHSQAACACSVGLAKSRMLNTSCSRAQPCGATEWLLREYYGQVCPMLALLAELFWTHSSSLH